MLASRLKGNIIRILFSVWANNFIALSGVSPDTNLLSTSRVAKDTLLPPLRASGAK